MKKLGKLAFERFAALFGVDHQRGRGGKVMARPGSWEELNDIARHRWEEFARGFEQDVVLTRSKERAEKERLATRSDLFEQEVRRQIADRNGNGK